MNINLTAVAFVTSDNTLGHVYDHNDGIQGYGVYETWEQAERLSKRWNEGRSIRYFPVPASLLFNVEAVVTPVEYKVRLR